MPLFLRCYNGSRTRKKSQAVSISWTCMVGQPKKKKNPSFALNQRTKWEERGVEGWLQKNRVIENDGGRTTWTQSIHTATTPTDLLFVLQRSFFSSNVLKNENISYVYNLHSRIRGNTRNCMGNAK